MIKKVSIFGLIVCLLLTIVSPGLVQARGELAILGSSAEAEFPSKLHFSLSARSDVDIADVRLHYVVDRESFARTTSEVYVDFMPGTKVDATWSWDMRKTGGLPPGSSVEYWWTVEDAKGDKVATTPAVVNFDDNRYRWQNITEGKLTIYWYEGDRAFAETIMLSAQETLTRLGEDTGAHLKRSAEIYLYASSQDLLGAMIFPQEWTGGVAFTRYGTIAIGLDPSELSWGRRVIAHELTHLVTHQMTFNPYNDLPNWLNEGLSMYAEGTLERGYITLLERAVAKDELISVRSLSSPFSAHAEESFLSYAQSYSLVEFLVNTYGQARMFELLNTFREGSTYDGALEEVYGFDMDGLNALWQAYVNKQYRGAEKTTVTLPVYAAVVFVS